MRTNVEITRTPRSRVRAKLPPCLTKAAFADAEADCRFFATLPHRRYWHRPVGPLEASMYLHDDGREWMPGVARPQRYAIMRCRAIERSRAHGDKTIAIDRRIELVTRETWKQAVERRKRGDTGADKHELASWADVIEPRRKDLRPEARRVDDIDFLGWAEMTGAL